MRARTKLPHDRTWLLLVTFIFLGVLAPTGAVLWFMNEAARNEAKSDRQRVKEAYRDRLRLVRDLVDSSWKRRSAALDSSTAENYTSSFLNVLQASGADGAVLLDGRGLPAYPGISVF